MTVLHRDRARVGPETARKYLIGFVMVTLGFLIAFGTSQLVGGDDVSAPLAPAVVEQARAEALAEHLRGQWLAGVQSARNEDLIGYHQGTFLGRVAGIERERATDMVRFRYGAWSAE